MNEMAPTLATRQAYPQDGACSGEHSQRSYDGAKGLGYTWALGCIDRLQVMGMLSAQS